MAYHPRIECEKVASFQTTRTRNSELWFVNNSELEQSILGYAAKYSVRYEVKLYALAIEGNHIQKTAHFPRANRAHFMRDFNSSVARAVGRYQDGCSGGRLWARRYSAEYLPGNDDIEDRFFYVVLQAVQDGFVDDVRDYPGYNCFEDAVTGTVRMYKVVNWKKYNDARRWNPLVPIEDFTELCPLVYARLPGYEGYSQEEYATLMREKLAKRTKEILETRAKPPVGRKRLRQVVPGSLPKKTKTSGLRDRRPRVLSRCPERRAAGEAWYFSIYFKYKECSKSYRAGELDTVFPEGTYRPPAFTVGYSAAIS